MHGSLLYLCVRVCVHTRQRVCVCVCVFIKLRVCVCMYLLNCTFFFGLATNALNVRNNNNNNNNNNITAQSSLAILVILCHSR